VELVRGLLEALTLSEMKGAVKNAIAKTFINVKEYSVKDMLVWMSLIT